MKKRPNILIFNPDEMRADALHHLGNPAAVTPNLDRFAAEDAVSFRRAFCQNPVCVPSRCSFFTGLYPHTRGHRTMGYLLHPGESSLLKELKDAGYYVWMNDRNDLTAGQIPGWTESHADEIYYGGRRAKRPVYEEPDLRGEKGNPLFYAHYHGKIRTEDDGRYFSQDDEVVEAAVERIRNRPQDRPLCMFLGLMYPHVPYEIEEPYFSAIDRGALPARIRSGDCTGKASILSRIRELSGVQDLSEEQWDEIRAVYLAMCMKVDMQFGRIIQALKQEGIYDNTAIFFLSDHGDFTGDYDLPEKAQNTFEHCLTNVPFLVKPPAAQEGEGAGVDPGICESLVELIDFYATAMDLAGVAPDHTHFGKSLVPVLSDRSLHVRDYVFCEGGRSPGETHCDEYHTGPGRVMPETSDYWPKAFAQASDEAHERGTMIFDGHFKYVCRPSGRDEFYDLSLDPGERRNIIGEETARMEVPRLRDAMLRWLQGSADIVPFNHDARFTEEMMWSRCRSFVPEGREEEVRSLIRSGISLVELMLYCRTNFQPAQRS